MVTTQETIQSSLAPSYITERQQQLLNNLFGTTSDPSGGAIDSSVIPPSQQVAQFTPTQQQAFNLAQAGLGSFEPFLTQAGADATAAQQFTGPQAFQEFMSPYQQEVIDTSLAALQRERDIARQQLGAQAAQLGAFGGGRQGLQEGAFDAETALGKAQLEAQ